MIKIIEVDKIDLQGKTLLEYNKRSRHEQHVTNCIIKRYGQFQPLLVEEIMGDYYLIAGRDILRALADIGITHAYCFVFENLDHNDVFILNMIQNQHREINVLRNAMMLDKMLEHGEEVNYKALANVLHHTRDEIHNFKQLKEFNWQDFDNDPAHFQTSLF